MPRPASLREDITSGGQPLVRTMFHLPKALKKQMMLEAVEQDVTLSELWVRVWTDYQRRKDA